VRHPVGVVLTLAALAVAAGASTLLAIGEWAADASAETLAAVGARRDRHGRYQPPTETTIRRVLSRVNGDALDTAISTWLAAHPNTTTPRAVAFDGKTLRGTVSRAGGAGVHLLGALDADSGVVLGQQLVPVGASELAHVQTLLDPIELAGAVVTADALHTTRANATYLRERGAHYVLTIKQNQHRLYHLLDTLPWPETPCHTSENRGHGRTERRTIRLLPAPEQMSFPHAAQVFLLERYATNHTSGTTHAEAVLGVTSLTTSQTSPATIATTVRNHWRIENQLHYVRDVTYREDACHAHTGSTPRALASLRNLTISTLRALGITAIATALRHLAGHPHRPLTLYGIPHPSQ
jgi:predicted transposase YbfD/YdcC